MPLEKQYLGVASCGLSHAHILKMEKDLERFPSPNTTLLLRHCAYIGPSLHIKTKRLLTIENIQDEIIQPL